jgi:anti-sigma factor RsiW
MTGTWDCQEARVALGVYVLGAIDPAERALVDAHLSTCEACRAELAEFAGLPGLLALVPAGEAIALAEGLSGDDLFPGGDFPGDELFADSSVLAGAGPLAPLPQLAEPPFAEPPLAKPPLPPVAGAADAGDGKLAEVHDLSAARRRRQRLAWAGVAAAVILVGGAFFGGAKLAGPAAPQASSAAQHPNGSPTGPLMTVYGSNGQDSATVAYQSMGWGIQMDALVKGIPVHTRCQMWVVENNGTRVQVGGWQTDAAEGTVWYPASASVPASSIRDFVITLASGPQITVMPA